MAKNRYKCNKCDIERYRYISIESYTCSCGGNLQRQLPQLSGHVQVTETVDKSRNIKHKLDQKKILTDRKLEYYWKIEVPKMVASGTYSLETMLEMQWVYYNEQGELCTRISPPESE